jgi:hypothetical protein
MGIIAPADTLLGQLQRGRGRGFVRALREDVSAVRPLLLDCVTHDPRWDRQLELRSDYYAALIMHTAMPLDPFDAYLRARSGTTAGDPNDLVLNTIYVPGSLRGRRREQRGKRATRRRAR